METIYLAFKYGGFWMYPIEIIGVILFIASIRYAIDGEPIRLRFITTLSILILAMMVCATIVDIILMFSDIARLKELKVSWAPAWADGISAIFNQWALGMLDLVLSLIVVAIGVYRAGRRQLKALKP